MRWSDWVHVMTSTRGHWLPGDPRGFRSHGHRVHSSGNYKNPPPPDEHEHLHAHARSVARPPVRLAPNHQRLAGRAMVEKLDSIGVPVAALAIDAVHAHALIRVGADDAVAVFGRAKQAASHALRSHLPGGIWGRSSHVVRINSREHGTNAKNYILAHADRGAWIYPTPEDPHPPEPTTRRRS
jgi:hypothetical protein